MSLRWVLDHQFVFLKALLFVIMDLTGEVGEREHSCRFWFSDTALSSTRHLSEVKDPKLHLSMAQNLSFKYILYLLSIGCIQVSNGALDMAKVSLEQMLRLCARTIPIEQSSESLLTAQNKSLFDVVHELVRHVTSPNTLVRDEV